MEPLKNFYLSLFNRGEHDAVYFAETPKAQAYTPEELAGDQGKIKEVKELSEKAKGLVDKIKDAKPEDVENIVNMELQHGLQTIETEIPRIKATLEQSSKDKPAEEFTKFAQAVTEFKTNLLTLKKELNNKLQNADNQLKIKMEAIGKSVVDSLNSLDSTPSLDKLEQKNDAQKDMVALLQEIQTVSGDKNVMQSAKLDASTPWDNGDGTSVHRLQVNFSLRGKEVSMVIVDLVGRSKISVYDAKNQTPIFEKTDWGKIDKGDRSEYTAQIIEAIETKIKSPTPEAEAAPTTPASKSADAPATASEVAAAPQPAPEVASDKSNWGTKIEAIKTNPEMAKKITDLANTHPANTFKTPDGWNNDVATALGGKPEDITAIQRAINAKPDGYFGPGSMVALLNTIGKTKEAEEYRKGSTYNFDKYILSKTEQPASTTEAQPTNAPAATPATPVESKNDIETPASLAAKNYQMTKTNGTYKFENPSHDILQFKFEKFETTMFGLSSSLNNKPVIVKMESADKEKGEYTIHIIIGTEAEAFLQFKKSQDGTVTMQQDEPLLKLDTTPTKSRGSYMGPEPLNDTYTISMTNDPKDNIPVLQFNMVAYPDEDDTEAAAAAARGKTPEMIPPA
jgi:hypothetical protein